MKLWFLFLIFIVSCGVTGNVIKEEGSVDVYFCSVEDCSSKFISFINSEDYVDCAFYNLKVDKVINALANRSLSVPVRLVMEGDNYKDQVKGDNIKVLYRKGWGIMHNKYCVSRDSVITGSFNPSSKGHLYDNNIVVIESSKIASNYRDEFNELWDEKLGEGGVVDNPVVFVGDVRVENYFCPEDGCMDRVISLIENAEESVYFMTFSFTHESVADAILKSEVDVRGVFDKQQAGSQYSQYKRLKDFGVDVILDNNKYLMHHKVFIIDSEIVVTGSANPTESGDVRNDENIVIIYDKGIAQKYLEEFERVYNRKI